MGIGGLTPQTFAIPLAYGLQQNVDQRALQPPGMSKLVDAQFDEIGGLQARKPYGAVFGDGAIFGGGTIANCRRLAVNGDELLCFTKDKLYAWSPAISKWIEKANHLACAVDEETAFATTGDQLDCDRAELAGVVVVTWCENGHIYVGAKDTSGGVTLPRTLVFTGAGVGTRPRIVALETKLLLLWNGGTDAAPGNLYVLAIDPADVLSSVLTAAAIVVASASFNAYYDVCKVDGADQAVFACRLAPTTSYKVGTITAGLVIATATKARSCTQPIAVASTPGGTTIQVLRSAAGAVGGDLLATAGFADVFINTAIGTYSGALNQLTGAYRSTKTGGAFRCYVFWSANEADNQTDWQSSRNWINDANAVGLEGVMVRRLGVASRAFGYDGRVFVWLAFAGASTFSGANVPGFRAQLQDAYFLYREPDDTTPMLVAKATFSRGGGFATSTGHLPGVALTAGSTTFSWCGAVRRVIKLGVKQTGFAARSPQDITFTFDDDRARRTVRVGATLYVTGGEILQYDGAGLFEVGFHTYPWYFAGIQGIGGAVEAGDYAYKLTHRWANAQGEVERSTTATHAKFTLVGGPASFVLGLVPLHVTHKTDSPPALEIWRTAKNPTQDAAFYLTTSDDPAGVDPNGYRANDPTLATLTNFPDQIADVALTLLEPNPENGAVLESLAPPAATIIAATSERVFLAGVAGDPDRVWYSRLRKNGEVASFHDGLTVSVPREGGDIVAINFMNGIPVVFRQTAIYALDGDGLDNFGLGQNYAARRVPGDVGAVDHDSVELEPRGLVFASRKGKYLLDLGWQCEYIGGPVKSYDDEPVLSVHVVEKQHQIRWLTGSRMLMLDYAAKGPDEKGQWGEWTIDDGLHAVIWQGTYVYLTATGPRSERTDYTGIDYGIDVELAPVAMGQVQGFGRIWKLLILGECRGAAGIRVRLKRNYQTTYFQDKTWTVTPVVVGDPLQLAHSPSIQELEAIQIRITVMPVQAENSDHVLVDTWSEALKLTSLGVELGLEQHLKPQPAAQRQ